MHFGYACKPKKSIREWWSIPKRDAGAVSQAVWVIYESAPFAVTCLNLIFIWDSVKHDIFPTNRRLLKRGRPFLRPPHLRLKSYISHLCKIDRNPKIYLQKILALHELGSHMECNNTLHGSEWCPHWVLGPKKSKFGPMGPKKIAEKFLNAKLIRYHKAIL